MEAFGLNLKLAREGRGLSLRQIATSTKISMAALEALERDDFSRLPGGIFSRAFVRAYATEVGIDPETTVQQFLVRLGEVEAMDQDASAPVEVSADDRAFLERQRKAAQWLRIGGAVLVVAVVIAVFAWRVMGSGFFGAKAAGKSTEANVVAPPAEPAPAPAPAPVTPAAAIVVQIEASDTCWVEAAADGKVSISRTFAAGERQSLTADREVVLQVGNAGAVQWSINGRAAKPLGASGTIIKNLKITRDNLTTFLR